METGTAKCLLPTCFLNQVLERKAALKWPKEIGFRGHPV